MLLEDYALIGDQQAGALVGRTGAVDWPCLPRFESASCLTALLGELILAARAISNAEASPELAAG